jgi:hypothetical protein
VVIGLVTAIGLLMAGEAPDLRSLAASVLPACTTGLSSVWMPAPAAAL